MNIKIIKSNRKTISITINDLGEIIVKAPKYVSNDKVNSYIESKRLWIEKHLNFKKELSIKYKQILSKEKGMCLGKIVDFTEDFNFKIIKFANDFLPNRVSFLANNFNFQYSSVKIKNYTARWGALDKNKTVFLNYKLMMLDLEVIDYVILHELCHTVHFNHKKSFYNLLSNYFKNEKQIKLKLKEFSFLLKIKY